MLGYRLEMSVGLLESTQFRHCTLQTRFQGEGDENASQDCDRGGVNDGRDFGDGSTAGEESVRPQGGNCRPSVEAVGPAGTAGYDRRQVCWVRRGARCCLQRIRDGDGWWHEGDHRPRERTRSDRCRAFRDGRDRLEDLCGGHPLGWSERLQQDGRPHPSGGLLLVAQENHRDHLLG